MPYIVANYLVGKDVYLKRLDHKLSLESESLAAAQILNVRLSGGPIHQAETGNILPNPANMNITITVPEGSTNHGNPNLLCTPPNWYDYVIFYFANYFAHAATVITVPGQGTSETIEVIRNALLLPTSGVLRAMSAIRRHLEL